MWTNMISCDRYSSKEINLIRIEIMKKLLSRLIFLFFEIENEAGEREREKETYVKFSFPISNEVNSSKDRILI